MTTSKKTKKENQPLGEILKALLPDLEDDDEIPSMGEAFWSKAQMGSPLKKQLISLRLDHDVIKWFKEQGPNYQTRMNQVLRTYMEYSKSEPNSGK